MDADENLPCLILYLCRHLYSASRRALKDCFGLAVLGEDTLGYERGVDVPVRGKAEDYRYAIDGLTLSISHLDSECRFGWETLRIG
jgi:hypothetical protein